MDDLYESIKRIQTIIEKEEVDSSEFFDVPYYQGKLDSIVLPKPLRCFPGAWYHKVVSGIDKWIGIEGFVRLGEFTPDEKRFNLDGKRRYMDNHGIYMGGCAILESDAGLGYNVMYPSTDTSYELPLSAPKLGYRPFYRYIVKERLELKGGNVDVINSNYWRLADPREFGYYYFPGDLIRMKVYCPKENYLQLRIEVVEPTKIEKYVEIRKRYGLENDMPKTYTSPLFYSEGHGKMNAEFKRVDSIDQYGNEGFTAQANTSKLVDETWYETSLYFRDDKTNKVVKIPFTSDITAVADFPNKESVVVKELNPALGGEIVTIDPNGVKANEY